LLFKFSAPLGNRVDFTVRWTPLLVVLASYYNDFLGTSVLEDF